eukprot:scaffold3226_cov251-Pinguiococcus_pyrenoidosus.AAC.6
MVTLTLFPLSDAAPCGSPVSTWMLASTGDGIISFEAFARGLISRRTRLYRCVEHSSQRSSRHLYEQEPFGQSGESGILEQRSVAPRRRARVHFRLRKHRSSDDLTSIGPTNSILSDRAAASPANQPRTTPSLAVPPSKASKRRVSSDSKREPLLG